MRFLALNLILWILANLQILDAQQFVHFSYQCPSYKQNRSREIDTIRSQIIPNHVLKKLTNSTFGQSKKVNIVNKPHNKIQNQQIKQLKQIGFSEQATQFLQEQKAVAQFNYEKIGHLQVTQFEQIKAHVNDLANFRNLEQSSEVAQIISQESFDYTLVANKANRENLTTVSDLFLTVAKNVLALGKGLVAGGVRNLVALADPCTYKQYFDLIGKLGVSLADAAEHLLELGLATAANSQEIVLELQERREQNLNQLQNDVGQLYQYLKHTWKAADLEERSEMIGNVLADGLFIMYGGKVNATMLRTGGKVLAPLSKYKPMALSKLGELGREINKATGLGYLKEYLRKGNQAVLAGEAGLLSAEGLGALCQDLEFLEHVKACDCTNAAHDLNQFEQLNKAFQIKEFTGIIKTTRHGIQRLIERGFTPADVKELIHAPDIVRTQLDNAKVFIRQLEENRYNILIYNQQKGAVITAIKKTDWDSLINLGKTYGWTL